LAKEQEEKIGKPPKEIIINYGQKDITRKQIDRQLYSDLVYVIITVTLAATVLRIGTKSTFMTIVGIFQILVRVPILKGFMFLSSISPCF
jgi:hypothetical protein